MARVDITQDIVLERIVERLRSELDLSEQRCYETLDPDSPPVVPPGGEYFLTVSPGQGRFVEGEQVAENLTEEWSVVVATFIRIHLDQPGRDTEVLRRAGRGAFAVKKLLLAALAGHDLTDTNGQTFLRNLLYATTTEAPHVIEGQRESGPLTLCQMKIEFGVDFDWSVA